MNFNPIQFGELLRALRGDRSQGDVAKGSGVSQQLLSSYEGGEVANPSFVIIARLANYYGVTLSDMAAMAGLAAEPGTEEDLFPPDVARDLQSVYICMLELRNPARQRKFAHMLQAVTDQMREIAESDDAIISSKLPSYIKRKLIPEADTMRPPRTHQQNSDGSIVEVK